MTPEVPSVVLFIRTCESVTPAAHANAFRSCTATEGVVSTVTLMPLKLTTTET